MLSINCKVIYVGHMLHEDRQSMAEEAGGTAISCPTSTDISWVLSMPGPPSLCRHTWSVYFPRQQKRPAVEKKTHKFCMFMSSLLPTPIHGQLVTHNQSSAKDNSSSPAHQIVIILARVNPVHYEPSPCIL